MERQDKLRSGRQLLRTLRSSVHAIGPDKPRVFILLALVAFSAGLQAMLAFLIVIVAVLLSGKSQGTAFVSDWIGVGLALGGSHVMLLGAAVTAVLVVLAIPTAGLQASLSSRALVRTQQQIISDYLGAEHAFRHTIREGRLQQLIGEYSQNVATAVQHMLSFSVSAMVILAMLVVPAFLNIRVALLELLVVGASAVVVIPALMRPRDARSRANLNREVAAQSAQIARVSLEIHQFAVDASVQARIGSKAAEAAALMRRALFQEYLLPQIFQYGLVGLVLAVMSAAYVFYPGYHPSFMAAALLTFRLLGNVRIALVAVQKSSALSVDLETFAEESEALRAQVRAQKFVGFVAFDGLTILDVVFAFPSGGKVLDGLSLTIAPGEAVGIIGASGSGKSTLAELMLGVRSPISGSVVTGGVPVASIDRPHWAALAAYLPQESRLITGTIAENIRFFREGISFAQIEDAARAAHVHDEIVQWPEGYETVVGSGARDLSGGQRQRLALARALLGKPKILILDEPSSALDTRSEELFATTLAELKGGMSLVIMTHRPAALRVCDRVYRLEAGRLVECRSEAEIKPGHSILLAP